MKAARHGSRKTPAFRTRWTLRLAASPRRRRLRRRLSRSCKLLPGHALGPSARFAGVNVLIPRGPLLTATRGDQARHRGGHRIPPCAAMTLATRSFIGAGREEYTPSIISEKEKSSDLLMDCGRGSAKSLKALTYRSALSDCFTVDQNSLANAARVVEWS